MSHNIFGGALPPPHQGGNLGRQMERAGAVLAVSVWNRHARAKQANTADSTDLTTDPQYPQTWDDYVGQAAAKQVVSAAIGRAVARKEPCRHVLIASGVPGIGKTAMAVLIARTLGTRCFTITGTPNWLQVRTLILSMSPGDVLFIDEIHRLIQGGKGKAEWLLHVLQDDALLGPNGIEKSDLGITVVGATTDASTLPRTIAERFHVNPVLVPYSEDEAWFIAHGVACRIFPPEPVPSKDDLSSVAEAANRNPRLIRQILESLVDSHYEAEGYNFDRVMNRLHITYDGLDNAAQRYLILLRRSVGAMGENQLRKLLREASVQHIELRLADKGLIAFTSRGRILTATGIERANELIAEGVTL